MVVLGLDQSTTKTGWSLFKDGVYIDSGVINLSSMKDTEARLLVMADKIAELVSSLAPSKVVIEDIYENNNTATLVLLGRLQGAIMMSCHEQDTYCEILPSATWRRLVGIKHRKREECKEAARMFARNVFDIDAESDEADAICIGYADSLKNK